MEADLSGWRPGGACALVPGELLWTICQQGICPTSRIPTYRVRCVQENLIMALECSSRGRCVPYSRVLPGPCSLTLIRWIPGLCQEHGTWSLPSHQILAEVHNLYSMLRLCALNPAVSSCTLRACPCCCRQLFLPTTKVCTTKVYTTNCIHCD